MTLSLALYICMHIYIYMDVCVLCWGSRFFRLANNRLAPFVFGRVAATLAASLGTRRRHDARGASGAQFDLDLPCTATFYCSNIAQTLTDEHRSQLHTRHFVFVVLLLLSSINTHTKSKGGKKNREGGRDSKIEREREREYCDAREKPPAVSLQWRA